MTAPTWQTEDGRVKLFHGDCLEILPTWPDGCLNALMTDPPYGIDNRWGDIHTGRNGNRRLSFSWDDAETSDNVSTRLALAMDKAARSAALMVWCGFDTARAYSDPARERSFVVKPFCWVKKCPPPPGKGVWWPSGFELGYYAYRRSPWFGDKSNKRCNVFVSDNYRHGQPGKVDHPTQKPLKLTMRHVSAIVRPGDLVADPFMGSGTTGVAALRLGRKFWGIEIDKKYFDVAKRRILDELNRHPLFEEPVSA